MKIELVKRVYLKAPGGELCAHNKQIAVFPYVSRRALEERLFGYTVLREYYPANSSNLRIVVE